MFITPPPQEVIDAIVGPTTRVTSRIEIYEQDAITRWVDDDGARLIDGTVGIDYSRDERRSLDLVLANSDGLILNAAGHFWYDKIIKVYRGVKIRKIDRPPRIIVVGGDVTIVANFRAAMASIGFDDIRINPLATDLSDLAGYEIVVSLGGGDTYVNEDLIIAAYDAGYPVFTQGDGTTLAKLPFVTTMSASTSRSEWVITPNTSLTIPVIAGWTTEDYPGSIGTLPTAIASYAQPVSPVTIDSVAGFTIIAAQNPDNPAGRWVHFHPDPDFTTNFTNFLESAFDWLNPYIPSDTWEVQIGEFLIDSIKEADFPRHVSVSGRDYAKKCLNARYSRGVSYDTGQQLESLIAIISASAGITKKVLRPTGITVNKESISFEQGVSRWQAMKDLATAYNYDLFFDNEGYLRLQAYSDPVLSDPTFTFQTGQQGTLATYEKGTNDSRLYNHVAVTGASDADTIPPWAEAINDDPESPTNVDEIGDRLYEYSSSFITDDTQAQDVADKFLAVHSLEEFSLDFSSIVMPWLEVGDIVEWIDPRPAPGDPTKFLLQSMSIPLGLGPMSASAGRVTDTG